VGVPHCRWVTAEDINDAGMIAAWQKPTAQYPNGCIELDQDHPTASMAEAIGADDEGFTRVEDRLAVDASHVVPLDLP
jgi:hypothetical protein